MILDRLEGRSAQQLDRNNVTQDLAARTDDELLYHMAHDWWPEDAELTDSVDPQNGRGN